MHAKPIQYPLFEHSYLKNIVLRMKHELTMCPNFDAELEIIEEEQMRWCIQNLSVWCVEFGVSSWAALF